MTVVRVAPDDDIAVVVRAAAGESLVIVIEPGRDPLAAAIAAASIGPLAVERAPAMRVNAVVAGGAAAAAAVDAMAGFLDTARSTTGQVVAIS